MDVTKRRIYRFEGFRLDAESLQLWRGSEHVPIPPKAIELLALLAENEGRIVETERILNTVWKDTFVETGSVNYTVTQLRKILGNRELIKSIPRRGYRLNAKVEAQPDGDENDIADRRTPGFNGRKALWVAGSILLLITIAGFLFSATHSWLTSTHPKSQIRSVAILPFRDSENVDPSRSYSIALTSSLIQRLGTVNRFRVRPFELVREYHQSGVGPIEFGRKIEVDAVLEGSIRPEAEGLKVTYRLLAVRDGSELMNSELDVRSGAVFEIRDTIAESVVRAVTAEVSTSNVERNRSVNLDAYRAYVRGRMILDQRSQRNIDNAESELLQSVSVDPAFALGYAGLAEVYAFRGFVAPQRESVRHYRTARLYAERSIELDPDLAEGYAALGRIKRTFDWDWSGALSDLRKAQELNPNLAQSYLYSSQLLAITGDLQGARRDLEIAAEIDPISQWVRTSQFPIFEGLGEYDEGLQAAETLFRRASSDRFANRAYATFLYHKKDYVKVIEISRNWLNDVDSQPYAWLSLLEGAYRAVGDSENADLYLARLAELAKNDTKAQYSLAINYAEAGRLDDAFAALERCFEAHEERLIWVRTEPRFANLKADERYVELLRRMNLS